MSLLHGLLTAFFPPRREPIDELRIGARAIVRGTVVPRDLIDSGLDGQRCVYYHYTVEEWRQSGIAGMGADGFWQVVDRDEAIVEFYLRDARGQVLVSPHRATVSRGRVAGESVDIGVLNQRAQQLLIRGGDWVEVEGVVEAAQDIFAEDRGYRLGIDCLALLAPTNDELRIRLLDGERDDFSGRASADGDDD